MSTMDAPVNQANIEKAAREHALRAEASKRASADPLPGPLAGAFGPLSIPIENFNVRPLVAYDWALMKKLNAPIFRQMLEWMQNMDHPELAEKIEFSDQEIWDMIYLLTRDCEAGEQALSNGVEEFQRISRREIAMSLHPGLLTLLSQACLQQVRSHLETMVKYEAEAKAQEGNGEGNFLSSAGRPPATVLAGGSTT